MRFLQVEVVEKFNPYHDSRGRFASSNSYASFTYAPGKSKAHDLAIARQKEKYSAENSALTKPDTPVHISTTYRQGRNTMSGASYMTQTVLEAKETRTGEITLDYANPTSRTTRNNGNVDYEYDLENGLYQSSNSSGINQSVGINWDNVTSVSGKTYAARSLLDQKGFYYDSQTKTYTKNKPTSTVQSGGKLVIPKGGSLPSDLSGVKSISGDTYANKEKIKAAGFKWNPQTKEWVKPGVTKSDTPLLDDEPVPRYVEITEKAGGKM